jgi:hypothetical protein
MVSVRLTVASATFSTTIRVRAPGVATPEEPIRRTPAGVAIVES